MDRSKHADDDCSHAQKQSERINDRAERPCVADNERKEQRARALTPRHGNRSVARSTTRGNRLTQSALRSTDSAVAAPCPAPPQALSFRRSTFRHFSQSLRRDGCRCVVIRGLARGLLLRRSNRRFHLQRRLARQRERAGGRDDARGRTRIQSCIAADAALSARPCSLQIIR